MEWYHISDILQYIRSDPRSGGSSNPPFSWVHISAVQCPMLCSWHDCPGTFDYPNVFVRRALAEEEIAYGRRDQKQWEAAVQDGNRRWMVWHFLGNIGPLHPKILLFHVVPLNVTKDQCVQLILVFQCITTLETGKTHSQVMQWNLLPIFALGP